MAKEFKTVEELVALLESRGVRTDEDTARAIERESYYAIVNGYKGPFLDREAMQSSSGDVFLEGTEFRWIYDLFLFDRELRFVTFGYLVRAEAAMRTAVAYAFSHNHPERNAYLERSNFCSASDYLVPRAFRGNKAALHSENLADLMTRLNNKVRVTNRTRDFIRHYVQTYQHVPLWVLSNDLTFGNIVHFYQLMKPREREEVCRIIARRAERDPSRGALTPRRLLRVAKLLNEFRNICAHDERLYCARIEGDHLGTMVPMLMDILSADESIAYMNEVGSLWRRYSERIHVMTFEGLLSSMGFVVTQEEGQIVLDTGDDGR